MPHRALYTIAVDRPYADANKRKESKKNYNKMS